MTSRIPLSKQNARIEIVAGRLASLVSECNQRVKRLVDDDYGVYLAHIDKNFTVPVPLSKYTPSEATREKIKDLRDNYMQELHDYRDSIDGTIVQIMTEPPSTEAVNYLESIKALRHPSEQMIQAAADRYGDNYVFASAIREIAHANRVSVRCPVMSTYAVDPEGIEHAFGNAERFVYGDSPTFTANTGMLEGDFSNILSGFDAFGRPMTNDASTEPLAW